jgi:hypothetical protein
MRRREFISLVGGAAAWPLAAAAQQAMMPLVGFMHSRGANDAAHIAAAFRRGLRDGGFLEATWVAARLGPESCNDRLPGALGFSCSCAPDKRCRGGCPIEFDRLVATQRWPLAHRRKLPSRCAPGRL